MTTNPFQSTAATGPQPHELMEAIGGAQPQMSVDSLGGNLLARRAPGCPTTPAAANLNKTSLVSGGGKPAGGTARLPLTGGFHSEHDAIARMNEHYFVGKSQGETAIFRINDDQSVTVVSNEEFRLEVQNIFVVPGPPVCEACRH